MSNQFDEQNVEFWDPDHYETGSTNPPKSNGGLVAILLVAVILLGGLCSALGIINIQLLRQLAQMQTPEETLSILDDPRDTVPDATVHIQDAYQCSGILCLELEGQTVSDFDRRFYDMPAGVLVLAVTEGGIAQTGGICTGDVITAVDGSTITGSEDLQDRMAQARPGQTLSLEIYRPKTQEKLNLTVALSEE